jgi:hypothetical protein
VTPLGGPGLVTSTVTGTLLLLVEPFPSWSAALPPQQ